jgi:hypothetical protein
MKYIIFPLLVFTFFFTHTSAQQNHFLYFQTENKQPFYIKINNQTFNSSSAGYLIVPKLTPGNHKIIFGSTKNEWPEQLVNYTLEKDAGFLIKNFHDKGWGLFDLQSLKVITAGSEAGIEMSNNTSTSEDNKKEETKTDNFSEMLATVVNDSTIKQKDVSKKQQDIVVKKEIFQTPEQIAPEKNEPAVEVKENDKENITQTNIAPLVLYSAITKNLQTRNREGMEMIYTDEIDNVKDTIRVFMPAEKNKAKTGDRKERLMETNAQANVNQILQDKSITDTTPALINNDRKVNAVNNEVNNFENQNNIIKEDKLEFLSPKSGMSNQNCKQYATEEDFLKLRKRMAAENGDEDMINAAKKVFKSKCFTTKYIKNLSGLFLNDEGRYNFFDAAYPHVSDSDVFSSLEDQLSDEYYVKRFKAMIHN